MIGGRDERKFEMEVEREFRGPLEPASSPALGMVGVLVMLILMVWVRDCILVLLCDLTSLPAYFFKINI
jgi:hypothetical protein